LIANEKERFLTAIPEAATTFTEARQVYRPTDRGADSTGCGMAFISWLMSTGADLGSIARTIVAGGDTGTLADLYAQLRSDAGVNAWPKFLAAVRALPNGVTDDDPFGGASQPAQLGHLAPWTVELAAKVFATILADIAAGKEPHQLTASVRAVLEGTK